MKPDLRSAQTISWASAALVLAFGAAAQADIYVETFDGPLHPAIWSLTTGGNEWEVHDGKLAITRTNESNGQLLFVPQLIGDFDVQFDYSLFWSSTFGFGDRIQLAVFTDVPQYSYGVGQTQEGFSFGYRSDPGTSYGFGANAATGSLRVTRTGSDLVMQHLDSGTWTALQTGTDSRDMWVSLDNYIHNSFTPGSRVEIDNFSISADQFSSPVPEPGSSVMLLGGFGWVIWRLRAARR